MVCRRWRPRGSDTVFMTGERLAKRFSTELPMEAQKIPFRPRFVEDTSGNLLRKGSEIHPRRQKRGIGVVEKGRQMPKFRIAIIGAGSVGFTRKLFADIVAGPELREAEFARRDRGARNRDRGRGILERMVGASRLPTTIFASTDRRVALEGARYVINCTRIGGLEAYRHDIEIPLKYGIDQCVGDTICAGGILYGQRNIPVILDFCRDIREVAAADAKFLNYANPMAMNTWAAIDHGKVDTIGLCHGIQHGGEQIADVLGAGPGELDFVCSGVNHQTWYVDVRLRGRKVGKDELVAAFERHPIYSRQEK